MMTSAESPAGIPAATAAKPVRDEARDLVELAVRGLEDMYDKEKQLFCLRSKPDNGGLRNEDLSLRYTIITLLGLLRYEQKGGKSPFDVLPLVDSLIRRTGRIDSLGDLGLLLWLCAQAAPERIGRISSAIPPESALGRFTDGRGRLTTELSWFLTGLVYASKHDNGTVFARIASEVFGLIAENYGGRGIFGHMGLAGSAGIRGRIGCFADQVYPIYAFSKYAERFESRQAAGMAERCADAICAHQGRLGQWWWHYDAISGKLRGFYPVYSVHQHAMAPMALFAASELTGRDYSENILRGVDWVRGNNELGLNMIDHSRQKIWRCIHEIRFKVLAELAYSSLVPLREGRLRGKLHVLTECRPYCLGWLLYAFA